LAIARLEVPARGRKELRRVGRVFTICMSRNNNNHGRGLSWGDSEGFALSKSCAPESVYCAILGTKV